jgi:hypothetical protein
VITGAEQSAPVAVVDHEGKHAVQGSQHARAIARIQMQQHFGVAMIRLEARSLCLQLASQLGRVHDLAVEHDHQLTIGAEHRLMATGDVEDAEALHGERHAIALIAMMTCIVGAAVPLARVHGAQQRLVAPPGKADDTAHRRVSAPRPVRR